jgi:2-dehydro-3-deoxyphosphogluconate aldolase/(4S)-4-hydroxy-2-oxoglutarate aldolase
VVSFGYDITIIESIGGIMDPILERLSKIGIVPVVKIDRVEDAVPLAKALCAGGLPCAEVTFRTEAASGAIKAIAENFPDMCIGAGTVLNAAQVDAASGAGAKFIVSPGLNPKTVKYCVEKGIPITPGTSTPSDIEQAIELGLDVVKFFPAEQSGGLAKIKAMAAPYVNMKFMPTGGIGPKNLISYLDFDKIIACGGSWMVPGDLINAGEWGKIEQLTREAVQLMLGFELAHIGVNAENEEEAGKAADRFAFLFGMAAKAGSSSIFAGTALEVMKEPYLGKNGHIAIKTNYIDRAVNYMETVLHAEFNQESAKRDPKGKLKAIYLKEEIGGFAVHLVQK